MRKLLFPFLGAVVAALLLLTMPVEGNIAASTISGDKIAAGTITGGNISGGTITGSHIAAGTIDATKLNVTQLSAITSNLGNVTAGTIAIAGGGQSFNVSSTGFLDVYSSEHDLVHVNTQIVNDGFLQVGGNLTMTARTGDASGYACFDANGTIFRSESGC